MCSIISRKLCFDKDCKICLNKSFASHDKSKYWSNENGIEPRYVFKGSDKKYMFDCDCGHTFESVLKNITIKNCWCFYCSNKILCNDKNCNICLEKSFASHERSKYWSKENKVEPRNVFKGSDTKYLFDCDCGHIFRSTLGNIIINGTWCPYCSNNKLCFDKNCKICLYKSFACHDRSKYWSKENKIEPRNVFKASDNKYKFDCDCNHTFESKLGHITVDGIWCPYCSNSKLCSDNNCKICFEKSFASHERSKYWSKENKIESRYVFKVSGKKYLFDCPYCNEIYEGILSNITVNNTWCSCTINKTEAKLYDFLTNTCKMQVEKQAKFDWCKNKKLLPFDFYIEKYKLIIELDGPQHFKQISNWQSPEEIQKNDKYKMKCANENGYSIIRILQENVFNDKNDWKNKLKESIKEYDNPSNIFIGDKDIYNDFIQINKLNFFLN